MENDLIAIKERVDTLKSMLVKYPLDNGISIYIEKELEDFINILDKKEEELDEKR